MLLRSWTLFLLSVLHFGEGGIVIDITPSTGRITVADQVSVQCKLVDVGSKSASILWYRRQGGVRYKLGSDGILTMNGDNFGNNRYSLNNVETNDKSRTYKLTITDAKLEDSATIECRLATDLSTAETAAKSITVCSDTSSTFCDCMSRYGWASPYCFAGQVDYTMAVKSRWNTVVGLIIALVVIVAYTLVMSLVWKRESLRQCCAGEATEEEQNLNGKLECENGAQQETSDSASDSATCSTSDPSSSGGSEAQGSSQSAASSQLSNKMLIRDQHPKSETLKTNEKSAQETRFVVKPDQHNINSAYREDSSDPITVSGHQKTKQSYVRPPPSSFTGQAAVKGYLPALNQNNKSTDYYEPTIYYEPIISTISGNTSPFTGKIYENTNDMTGSQALGSHASGSLLNIAGTEI